MNFVNPINKFCVTIGMLPSSYRESLTYEEQLLAIGKYLNETIYPALNNNIEAINKLQSLFNDLKNYVDNYFDNLDVQTEINNKIDELASNGFFSQFFSSFISENITTFSKVVNNTNVFFTKIPFLNQNNKRNTIKIGIANDLNQAFSYENPLDFGYRKNATSVLCGGIWNNTTGLPIGNNLMIDGIDINSTPTNSFYSLGIKDDGTLTSYNPNITKEEIIADGCHNTIGGYYPILINGNYPPQEILNLMGDDWNSTPYPRTVIAQTSNKTVYFMACNGKNVNSELGLTYKQCADILLSLQDNVQFAYTLDGGGSTFVSYRNLMLNTPTDSIDNDSAPGTKIRDISSFLFVANPIITDHDKDINFINYSLSKMKHLINNNTLNNPYVTNFQTSYLRLLNPLNSKLEGIEVFENNNRVTKLQLQNDQLNYFDYVNNKAICGFTPEYWMYNNHQMADLWKQAPKNNNLNDINYSSFNFVAQSAQAPNPNRYYLVITLSAENGNSRAQIAIPFTADEKISKRAYTGGNWTAWLSS